jgi:ENTS family enterobactin (siderophore) exporter
VLEALRSSRDFRLLIAGELVSRAGTAASFIAVWAVAVYEFDVGPGALSLLMLCNSLPRVVASSVAGRMIDRHDPRRVLLAANAVGAVGSILQWASPSPLTLGLASLVAGAGFGAFMPAIGSMSPRVVADRYLLQANAALELTWQIGFIVGPLAGAAAIALGGARAPLLFDAATFVVGSACVLPLRLLPLAGAPGHQDEAGGPAGDGFVSGLRYTWSLAVARFVLILNTGSWMGVSFFIVLEPLYVDKVLGQGPVVLGLLQTAFGTGAIAGAVIAARSEDRVGARLLAITIGVCGFGMVGYTASTSVAIAAAGVTVWGIGIGMWAPVSRTMIHRGVPGTHHGRVNGVMSSLQSGFEVLPVLAAGQLAAAIGIQPTLIGAGVGTLALATWGLARAATVTVPRASDLHDDGQDQRAPLGALLDEAAE